MDDPGMGIFLTRRSEMRFEGFQQATRFLAPNMHHDFAGRLVDDDKPRVFMQNLQPEAKAQGGRIALSEYDDDTVAPLQNLVFAHRPPVHLDLSHADQPVSGSPPQPWEMAFQKPGQPETGEPREHKNGDRFFALLACFIPTIHA
jgi:hypothetical protein